MIVTGQVGAYGQAATKNVWWETNRKGNILETDGEVDEVKVEVLKAEILQTPPAGRLHMFRSMKRVPKFRCYEDLLPSADTGFHRALDPFSHLRFSVLSGEKSKL